MKGLDVSLFQGDIDWKKVKKDGYEFAMIKATQGKDYGNPYSGCFEDPKFKQNIVHASDAGRLCGTYHYICAVTEAEAVKEAEYFCNAMKPYKDRIKLWAAVDAEDVNPPQFCGTVSKETLTKIIRAFCNTVKANGFKPMLYSNTSYLYYHLNQSELKDIPLWYACWYDGSGWTENDKPVRDFSYKIWQYGYCYTNGIGNGQSGVDGDFGYFTTADIDGYQDENEEINIGDIIGIKQGVCYYGTSILIPSFVYERDWVVEQVVGDRIYFDKSVDGSYSIASAVARNDCYLVAHKVDPVSIEEGDVVTINEGAYYYNTSVLVPDSILNNSWYVEKVYDNDTALVNKSVEGGWEINSIISMEDLTLVEKASDMVVGGDTEPEPVLSDPEIGGGEVSDDEPITDTPPIETPTEPDEPITDEPIPVEPDEPIEEQPKESYWVKFFKALKQLLIVIGNLFKK